MARYALTRDNYGKWRVIDLGTMQKVAHFPSQGEALGHIKALNARNEAEKLRHANPV